MRAPGGERPNLLLVSLDSVRPDRLSAYGYARDTSPALAALAGESILWERAYSAAHWTLPAHTSMLTGAAFSYHRVGADDGPKRLADPALVTLPELLRAAGYRTAGFTNAGFLSQETCFDRGFELLRWTEESVPRSSPLYDLRLLDRYVGRWWNGFYQRRLYRRRDRGGATTIHRAAGWIHERAREGSPFFAFVHLMDAHSPYTVPAGFHDRYVSHRAMDLSWVHDHVKPWYHLFGVRPLDAARIAVVADVYDGAVAYVDHLVGRLLDALCAAGVGGSTAVVVTADHGESLGERGSLGHGGDVLYEPVVRVPLLVRPPGGGPRRRSSALVSHLDLLPTVATLCGLDLAPFARQVHGVVDLCAELEGKPDRAIVVECLNRPPRRLPGVDHELPSLRHHTAAVLAGRHKLLVGSDGRRELYDLEVDPGELDDLAASHPELVARLERRRRPFASRSCAPDSGVARGAVGGGEERPYSIFVADRLRALGYLD